jgi:ribosomal protein S18 acetylase RimI-like enzyme
MARTVTEYAIRPLQAGDTAAVLEVINTDRLVGQPEATEDMLAEAAAGRSVFSSGWWAELAEITTEVAVARTGRIAGVVSHAIRPRDEAGLILWLHAGEEPAVVGALLDHALARFDGRAVEAFPFATALGLGLEALPMGHRPVTHAALLERGFTGTSLWRYMRTELPIMAQSRTEPEIRHDGVRRTLQIRESDRVVGEAVVGMPVQGIGVLWWIGMEPTARELELNKALLGSALEFLSRHGAEEVIFFISDEPDAEHLAAVTLYEQAGFVEIDRLYAYRRDQAADA